MHIRTYTQSNFYLRNKRLMSQSKIILIDIPFNVFFDSLWKAQNLTHRVQAIEAVILFVLVLLDFFHDHDMK